MWRPNTDRRFLVLVGLAAAALFLLLLQTYPLSYWEYDELLFGAGVISFEPLVHHPHPPGYPAFIGLGKAFNFVIGDPFTALVALSATSTLVGFIALAVAFRNLLKDEWLGLGGALLFYLSAGMVMHATLAMSDATAMAFLALALLSVSKVGTRFGPYDACWFGLTASLAVGCRPQLAVMILPLMALVALRDRSRSRALVVAASFTVVSLFWFLPLVVATGGPSGFMRYQFDQAARFAASDAGRARIFYSSSEIALRFLAHPWGWKLLSLPVVGLGAVGLTAMVRRKDAGLLSIVVSAGLYLAFAASSMDPADGVRYALPITMTVSLVAASGLGVLIESASRLTANRGFGTAAIWRPVAVVLLAALFAVGSIRYVAPLVVQRHTVMSPPAQAAAWARDHLPSNGVILYEMPMQPHARQLFSSFRSVREDSGEFQDRTDVPLFVLADHQTTVPDATTFSWNDSDAYGKLTRVHYRVVSLAPIPTRYRYRTVRGVYAWDWLVSGERWRWLAPTAEIALPDLGATTVRVGLRLPPEYPWESNVVNVSVNGQMTAEVSVRRGEKTDVSLNLPQGVANLTFVSARTFVPARDATTLVYDDRKLGVMLLEVEQLK